MNAKKKALVLVLCALMLVAASVFGTLAYLTDTQTVTNTFTVGDVQIELTETAVNSGSQQTNNSIITDGETNTYHLLPGSTFTKDPTVKVLAGSENCYVRMKVTFSFYEEWNVIFEAAPNNSAETDVLDLLNDLNVNWERIVSPIVENNTCTYEFRYKDIVPKSEATVTNLGALFKEFSVPDWLTNEQLKTLVQKNDDTDPEKITDQFKITVVAHAIQSDGFDTPDNAWAAFDSQT